MLLALVSQGVPTELSVEALCGAQSVRECRLTVRLSLSSCIISVLSLYDSSFKLSSSAMASSKACPGKEVVRGREWWRQQRCFPPPLSSLSRHSHLLGQSTGLIRRVEDLVVEDGEVEGQAESDGMCGLHLFLTDVKRHLVRFLGFCHRSFERTQRPSYCRKGSPRHDGIFRQEAPLTL